MDNHYYLLLTNNKDKYYEYFWLSFKQSIYEDSSIYIQNEIDIYSNKMNEFQKQKKYEDILLCIEEFFSNNINRIIAEMFLLNKLNLGLLKTNIHRLNKFQPSFVLKSIEYDLLVIITNMIDKGNYNKIELIDNYFNQYFQNCISFDKYKNKNLTQNQKIKLQYNLYNLVNLCIEHNIISLIDMCARYIDITLFYKENVDKKRFKYNKGNKLIKLLEKKCINDIIL